MRIYPELKKAAGACQKIKRLQNKLSGQLDFDDMSLFDSELISGCSEKKGHLFQNGRQLDNMGLQFDQYYLYQETGFCEDDYHGMLYFKTDVPGQFVSIPFWA